jgi:hypothetical protein
LHFYGGLSCFIRKIEKKAKNFFYYICFVSDLLPASSIYFLVEQIVFSPLQGLTRTLSIELSLEGLRIRRDPKGSLK